MKYAASIGPFSVSFRSLSAETPALLMRMSIVVLGKCVFAAARILVTASSGVERSACTDTQRMECLVESWAQRSSVLEREDSEVKFRRSEQPLLARFLAMASPIPSCC